MKNGNKVIVSEHVFEVRHQASGRFLDVRGQVADHVRTSDMFPHWEIKTNVVVFRDAPKEPQHLGAFAGYKSSGLFAYDPETRNYFEDKSGKYWRTLLSNKAYSLPELTRFGCRTKAFVNSSKSFEELNSELSKVLFSNAIRELSETDVKDFQAVIEFSSGQYKVRLVLGPIHKEEADRYFSFESEHFAETGLFLDMDVYRTTALELTDIPNYTKDAMKVIWERIDRICDLMEL